MDFNYNRDYEVGDVIYPFYNSSNKWYKTKVWIVITAVDKNKRPLKWHYSYNKEIAELYSMIIKLEKRFGENGNKN